MTSNFWQHKNEEVKHIDTKLQLGYQINKTMVKYIFNIFTPFKINRGRLAR